MALLVSMRYFCFEKQQNEWMIQHLEFPRTEYTLFFINSKLYCAARPELEVLPQRKVLL